MSAGSRAINSWASATLLFSLALTACDAPGDDGAAMDDNETTMEDLVNQYAVFRLEADLSHLSENDRQVVRLLIAAAQPMDDIFWNEAYGDKEEALALAQGDEATRRYIEINYGPWDRLRGDGPFIEGVGNKPAGANFYPADVTAEEFEVAAAGNEALRSLYTLVRRGEDGSLVAQPYHEVFADAHAAAAAKLREAAELASDPELATYLQLRADALESDDYQPSDLAWLDMKENPIDVVIGPIETYEDQLFGAKAAHEGYVLIKDMEWSGRLARFAALLPSLQESLPVPGQYKSETPGTDSDLNAYDAVYYSGDANAGAKTIAINLPNDEEVQLAKGTRRLQLKNAMQAKFDRIMVPIAGELIDEEQQEYVVFDAFFGNTMFHEVAHGLGVKNTVTGMGDGEGSTARARLPHGRGEGGRGGPPHGDPALRTRRTHGLLGEPPLRDLPGGDLPLDPLRCRERPRPCEHGALQLFPGAGSLQPG